MTLANLCALPPVQSLEMLESGFGGQGWDVLSGDSQCISSTEQVEPKVLWCEGIYKLFLAGFIAIHSQKVTDKSSSHQGNKLYFKDCVTKRKRLFLFVFFTIISWCLLKHLHMYQDFWWSDSLSILNYFQNQIKVLCLHMHFASNFQIVSCGICRQFDL